MAHVFAHEGDTIEIGGKEFTVVIAGDEYAHNEPDAYALIAAHTCKACRARLNDDGWEAFCAGCVEKAMRIAVFYDAFNYVIESDREAQMVLARDSELTQEHAQRSEQYMDVISCGWDYVRGLSANERFAIANMFTQRMLNYIEQSAS